MKIGDLISVNTLTINSSETDPSKRFPELVGTVKKITLQKGDEVYFCIIKYSYSANWLVISITDDNDEVLQQNTYMAEYPINLNQVTELLEYGLFYKAGKIAWFRLDDNFYNLASESDQLYEEYSLASF